MSHTYVCPVASCRQSRSALPSPSKSPTPTIFQFRSGTVNGEPEAAIAAPFISHTYTSPLRDRKSTRLNSSHSQISYAVFCLKKNIKNNTERMPHDHHHLGLLAGRIYSEHR